MKETYLSANIETAYIKAWYDEAAKRLLCDKYILAWIIISVIDEYKDCSVQYVRGCLIEGDVRTMSETVNPNKAAQQIDRFGFQERIVTAYGRIGNRSAISFWWSSAPPSCSSWPIRCTTFWWRPSQTPTDRKSVV